MRLEFYDIATITVSHMEFQTNLTGFLVDVSHMFFHRCTMLFTRFININFNFYYGSENICAICKSVQ